MLCFCLLSGSIMARDPQFLIQFIPVYGKVVLNINGEWLHTENGDSIKLEVLKFYISGIKLKDGNKIVYESNLPHLIDCSDEGGKAIMAEVANDAFNKIEFNLGIDSIINVSGAMGGDLDPTRGMYWTWQSGYINMKLEGITGINKQSFQFHLGGYQFPENALRSCELDLQQNSLSTIVIQFDIQKLLQDVDPEKINHVMSPGSDAMILSDFAIKSFSIRQQ